MHRLENTIRDIDQKKGVTAALLRPVVSLASILFGNGVKARNLAYDFGLKKQRKADIPVVSIGNIVAGGTGKTPFTLYLAKTLAPYFQIAILSRGYRSKAEKSDIPLIVSRGEGPLYPPNVAGDEAYLLSSNFPDAIVVSGKNRFLAAQMAKELGATLILLDDGMQHRKLYRDLEIVLFDGKSTDFLPKGRLRDEEKRLEEADFIVTTSSASSDFAFTSPSIEIAFRNDEVVFTDGSQKKELNNIHVAIFCGIAQPSKFEKSVELLGAKIVLKEFLADHQKMEGKKLLEFSDKAKNLGAEMVLCTEKDWIKLESITLPLPLGMVKQEVIITKNALAFDALIKQITKLMGIDK